MSSLESETKSGSGSLTKNNTTKREEAKNFDMRRMAFYNPELISKRKVIINTSTSKQMFSFPTTKRFTEKIKDDSTFFYNIRTPFNKRSTSFGYGKKVAFLSNNQYPGPGSYHNLLNINKKGRYAISDLPNTQQNKFCNEERFRSQTIANDYPSPSSYYPESMIKGNGIIYNSRYRSNLGKSMGQRLEKVGQNIITPGPGSYKYMNLNISGKYPSSLLSNSQQNQFGKEIRFKPPPENRNPGPDAYKPESLIKGNGIVYNSRYSTNLGKTMGIKLNYLNKSITPGPGAYEFFSDFEGFYKYGKNEKKKGKKGEDIEAEDNENKTDEGNNGSSSENTGDSAENGKLLTEVFGKDVNEEISKVKIKKPKLE